MRNNGRYPQNALARIILHAQIQLYKVYLNCINHVSRRPITGSSLVDVSLTTYGLRTHQVWAALETIGRGSARPARVILWHEDSEVVDHPPPALRRLQRRGLEIKKCKDYGPHKKYFPYVLENDLSRPLVTADDDALYPRDWLVGLLAVYSPGHVAAYRAHKVSGGPYRNWPPCTDTVPSTENLATGVSGIIYPPRVLAALQRRGSEFMSICPNADDFWLHYAAVASGTLIRQVNAEAATWWPTQPRQRGLWCSNQFDNDRIMVPTRDAWLGPPASV